MLVLAVLFCLRALRAALPSDPYLAHPIGGGAVPEVLHDLRCGLALSIVRHDLPWEKNNKKKKVLGGRACSSRHTREKEPGSSSANTSAPNQACSLCARSRRARAPPRPPGPLDEALGGSGARRVRLLCSRFE